MDEAPDYNKESHPKVVEAFHTQQDALNRFTQGHTASVIFNEELQQILEEQEKNHLYDQL